MFRVDGEFLAKPFLSLCANVLLAQLMLEQGKLGSGCARVKVFKTDPKRLLLSQWDGDSTAPLLAMGFQSIKAIVGKLPPQEELEWPGASQVMK